MATAHDLARSSPAGLAYVESRGAWIPAPHLIQLSKRLCDVAAGRLSRLMVFMPPRHGKSELISKYTPAWYLGNFPDRKVMLTSYADTFAAQWGRKARDVLEATGPRYFGVRVSPDSKSAQQWEVIGRNGRRDGVMVTAGVGGGLTGKGGHLIIIDDPIKNAEEAHSQVTRDAHHDWWRSTVRTRLQRDGAVVLVMTRWHEDDLAGRLLADQEDGGDEWEVLCLPGFAEASHPLIPPPHHDPLDRSPGEPLWPEMFDTSALEQTRKAMGSYWFTAMYQQRPAPAEGALFKRKNFRYYERTDSDIVTLFRDDGPFTFDIHHGMKFCTMDVAGSSKTAADFTVIATWAVTPHRDLILWDIERVQFEGPDLAPLVRRVYYEQRPSIIGIERLGFGLTIIQELVRDGLPIVRLEPDADKVSRALPAAARYEEHRVFHPRGHSLIKDFEHELLSFPNAAHDDQVDAVAYAALQLPMIGPSLGSGPGGYVQSSKGKTITGGLLADML